MLLACSELLFAYGKNCLDNKTLSEVGLLTWVMLGPYHSHIAIMEILRTWNQIINITNLISSYIYSCLPKQPSSVSGIDASERPFAQSAHGGGRAEARQRHTQRLLSATAEARPPGWKRPEGAWSSEEEAIAPATPCASRADCCDSSAVARAALTHAQRQSQRKAHQLGSRREPREADWSCQQLAQQDGRASAG